MIRLLTRLSLGQWYKKMLKKAAKDDRGISMVMVVVILAFVALLLSMITYMSLYSYQMRTMDFSAQNTFYSAEMALNEIKAGLEKEVSTAVNKGYFDVMENYAEYSEAQRASRFQYDFFHHLTNCGIRGASDKTYDPDVLMTYLTQAPPVVTVSSSHPVMETYLDRIVLEDVTVTYTDPDNSNVSIISTDINLLMPNLDFNRQLSLPEIVDYALISSGSVNVAMEGSVVSNANVYAGLSEGETSSFIVGRPVAGGSSSRGGIEFRNCEYVVSRGDVEVAGSGSYFEAGEGTGLWAGGIDVTSSAPSAGPHSRNLNLSGSSYIKDDLTVSGTKSVVKLAGSYYGYGKGSGSKAEGSSAILLNGYKTSLDMENLSQLVLAGNAFIGMSGDGDSSFDVYESGVNTDSTDNALTAEQGKDIRMGESLASKAGQIAYLVPPECIGWTVKDGQADKCVLGKNPVSSSEYRDFIESFAEGGLATADNIMEVDLSSITDNMSSSYKFDEEHPYRVVIPQGSDWRYYYLNFANEQSAGNFFRDYYNANHEFIDRYISSYIGEFKFNDSLTGISGSNGGLRLNLAGNIFYPSDSGLEGSPNYIMISPEDNEDTEREELRVEYEMYSRSFDSLSRILSADYSAMSVEQSQKDVFDNLVSKDNMNAILNGTSSVIFKDAYGRSRVYVSKRTDSSDTLKLSEITGVGGDKLDPSSGILVITSQDVEIDVGFTGTILTSGSTRITNGADIFADSEKISECLNLTREMDAVIGGETVHEVSVANIFNEGADFAAIQTGRDPGESVDATVPADSLVTFSNWTKK